MHQLSPCVMDGEGCSLTSRFKNKSFKKSFNSHLKVESNFFDTRGQHPDIKDINDLKQRFKIIKENIALTKPSSILKSELELQQQRTSFLHDSHVNSARSSRHGSKSPKKQKHSAKMKLKEVVKKANKEIRANSVMS